MNESEEIGRRICARLTELDMTQADLAAAIGVNKSTVQRYVTGQISRVKLPVLEAMARALRCAPDWLTGKTDRPEGDGGDDLDGMIEELRTDADRRMLFQQLRGATPEEVRQAAAIIEALRRARES